MQDKLTKSARGESCALRIPGYCCFDADTVVFAHAPCVKKGMGIKGPSWWGAYACLVCHDVIDRRIITDLSNAEIAEILLPGIFETQNKLLDKGLIKI